MSEIRPAKDTSYRDRVKAALSFEKPDRTPCDFAAVPEVWERLSTHFSLADRNAILEKLEVDCRVVSYDSFCQNPHVDRRMVDLEISQERSSVGGMWRKLEPDGSNRDIWGAHRRKVPGHTGAQDQFASFPLAQTTSLEDLPSYDWPHSDWWDFSLLRPEIMKLNETAVHSIRFRLGSVFETSWSLCGFEKFLLDLTLNPTLPTYVMERVSEVHLENLRKVLNEAGDLIDIVYFYDDIATQQGLLISPKMYEQFVQPFHQQIIDVCKEFAIPTMMHCCGSVYPMIRTLIRMGLRILNPIQPTAKEMGPERLREEFGEELVFHGGIDIQRFLPSASAAQVEEEVKRICQILGKQGGYIMSGSHHLQAETPIENILAMYGALKQ